MSQIHYETVLDTEKPNVARMYDYYLGGTHNYPIDQELAKQVIANYPDLPLIAKLNRVFLTRVVRYLGSQGVKQFIDIGSGLPTQGNVHEIAHEMTPDARVVYVDYDQIAVTYSRMMLIGVPNATVVHGDFRDIRQILEHRDLRHVIDFAEPVGILVFGLMHFIVDDDNPLGTLDIIADTVSPGSYLAMSMAARDQLEAEAQRVEELYRRSGTPTSWRKHEEILPFFDRFPLVEPGLIPFELWHPELHEPDVAIPDYSGYGGVGRKP